MNKRETNTHKDTMLYLKVYSSRLMRIINTISVIIASFMILVGCTFNFEFDDNNNELSRENLAIENIVDKGPVNGGSLNMFSTIPDTLNPLLTDNLHVQKFSMLIFESLVKIDASQRPVPYLAKSWEATNNALEWVFNLNENVFWHDGRKFTAEDVAFTLDTLKSSHVNSIYKQNVINIKSYEILDEYTIKLTLFTSDSFTSEAMTFPILSKNHYGGIGDIKSAGNITPIGTGPYKFDSYTEDTIILLKANENWWNSENVNGLASTPHIANIGIKIYADEEDIYEAFESRNIDFFTVNHDQSYKFAGRTDINIKKFTGRNFEFISFNLFNPLLSDVNIRKAISLALDKFEIMNEVLVNKIILSDIPIIPGTLFNDGMTLEYSNTEKAALLLDEEGWKISSSGKRYKNINGTTQYLNLKLIVNKGNVDRIMVAEKIKAQLSKIGINIEIEELNWADYMKNLNDKKFDIAFMGIRVNSRSDLSSLYSSKNRYSQNKSAYNVSGYTNESVDYYLNKILSENDISQKKASLINMKQIIADEVPYIGLYFYYDALIYHKKLKGVSYIHVWDPLMDIPKWYIPNY